MKPVPNVRSSSPKLVSFEYEVNENFEPKDDGQDSIRMDVSNKVDVLRHESFDNAFLVKHRVYIFDSSDFSEVPFRIRSIMTTEVTFDAECDEDLKENVLYNNAPAMMFSYLRPFISQVVTFSGFPALILPFMGFRDDGKDSKE